MDIKNRIVKRMVSIFKKMDTDEYVNTCYLCQMAVESLGIDYNWEDYDEDWWYYDEFHEERIKQKIRIKSIDNHGLVIGTPPNCHRFARRGEKTKRQKDYEVALKNYKKKFKELPPLEDDVCDAVLKPREQLTKILNRAVKRGTKVRDTNLYVSAWKERSPKCEED